ncbi:MAG: wax ester/triacylglycerol synthase domain-containing protein [Rhizobiaceae bacterium]
MTPVPPFENMMLKIGRLRPIAAWIFDRPPDPGEILVGLAAASRRIPQLRQHLVRRFGWHFWVPARGSPDELFRHAVTLVDDPALRDIDDLRRLLQKLDAMPFPADRPPWRALVINAGGAGLPALVFQCEHAIADGIRIERIMRNFGAWAAADREAGSMVDRIAATLDHRALADILALPDERGENRHDMVLTFAPAAMLRRGRNSGSATAMIIGAMADALAMPGTLAPGAIRSGLAMELIGERRPGSPSGNFVAAQAVPAQPANAPAARGRSFLFYLLARTGPWRFRQAALFPAALTRIISTSFYRRFDIVASVMPSSRKGSQVGAARADRVFGIGPVIGDTHVSMTGFWSHGDCCLSIKPGPAIAISSPELADRFLRALEARAGPAETAGDGAAPG